MNGHSPDKKDQNLLHELTAEIIMQRLGSNGKRDVLLPVSFVAAKYLFSKWGIRPSQRRKHRPLFESVKQQVRMQFNDYLERGSFEIEEGGQRFSVYEDEGFEGEFLLRFVKIDE